MRNEHTSPYLNDPNRLSDVLAAIQATATYKYYKLDLKGWSDRINGDEKHADHWRRVFEEHPEFFRFDSKRERVSLIWRRQHQKRYDIDQQCVISHADYLALGTNTDRISRTPLEADEISILIQAATSLYSSALEQKREKRWWVPAMLGLVGVILGSIVTLVAKN